MKLIPKFSTVGGATLTSRILGFFRDVLIAASIGTGPVADAFFVAFRLPNLFRRLFAEGAFSAAFIPLFTNELENNGELGAKKFSEEVLAILVWGLVVLTIIAEIFAPIFVYVLAPGFFNEPEKYDLAVLLTRITFPYLLCMSVLAFISGILNSFNRFAAAAFTPVLLNIVMLLILSIVIVLGLGQTWITGILLAVGVTVAGICQVVVLGFVLNRHGFRISLKRPRLSKSVKKMISLGIPGIIAGGITQINIAIGTIIASTQAGAVSYLYYADRVYQLPLGVVGIAIATVLLPSYSRQINEDNKANFLETQNRSLEFGLALTLPAAIALIVIPEPIIAILFERGEFGANDTLMTTRALAAFGIGLPAFVLIKLLSPGFFARKDTRTPMYFAAISMTLNVLGSLVLFQFIGHVGIALATSIAGWVNAILLALTLKKQGYFTLDDIAKRRFPMLLLASMLMGLAVWFGTDVLADYIESDQLLVRFGSLILLVGFGMAFFALIVQITGTVDLKGYVRNAIREKNISDND